MMAVCPQCGHHNRPGTLACERCFHPFINTASEVATRQLDDVECANFTSNYGSEYFGPDDQLVIEVRDGKAPIVVKDIKNLILGRTGRHDRREPDVDFTPFEALSKGVSQVHAAITAQDNAITIRDMGSLNGTFINGQRLIANRDHVLHDGDEIWLGHLVVRTYFHRPSA